MSFGGRVPGAAPLSEWGIVARLVTDEPSVACYLRVWPYPVRILQRGWRRSPKQVVSGEPDYVIQTFYTRFGLRFSLFAITVSVIAYLEIRAPRRYLSRKKLFFLVESVRVSFRPVFAIRRHRDAAQ